MDTYSEIGEDGVGSSFLAWLHTFSPAQDIVSLSDLLDGQVLGEILHEIDPEFFGSMQSPQTVADESGRDSKPEQVESLWNHAVACLSKLGLQDAVSRLAAPDFPRLVLDPSKKDAVKVAKLLLLLAVQSEQRSFFIGKIEELAPEVQTILMESITSVLESPQGLSEQEVLVSAPEIMVLDSPIRLPFSRSFGSLRSRRGKGEDQREEKEFDLTTPARERDGSVAVTTTPSKGTPRGADHLLLDIQDLEDQLAQKTEAVREQEATIFSLRRKVRSLEKEVEETRRLREEAFETKQALLQANEKLRRSEIVMQKYRSQLERTRNMSRPTSDESLDSIANMEMHTSTELKKMIINLELQCQEEKRINSKLEKQISALQNQTEQAYQKTGAKLDHRNLLTSSERMKSQNKSLEQELIRLRNENIFMANTFRDLSNRIETNSLLVQRAAMLPRSWLGVQRGRHLLQLRQR